MGLSVSDAVRALLVRVAAEKAVPFALRVPNATTRAAMAEADEMARAGRYDLTLLKVVMLLLIANRPEWRGHAPMGSRDRHGECHVADDFPLIYRLDEGGKAAKMIFVCTGTHAESFQ